VVGFSLMLPLLGAAVVSPTLRSSRLIALVGVGLAFHIFGYLSNDLVDLPIDRTQPLRADSPLVRGLVRPSVAWWVAMIPVPGAAILAAAGGGPPIASAMLLAGMAFGLFYNLFGKRLRWPLIGDAVQALAWVALTLFGALSMRLPLKTPLLWLTASVFVYVLLVNAFHGAVRDLENDARHRTHTTASFLGARRAENGALIVPPRLIVYGLALQSLLLLCGVLGVVGYWPQDNRMPWQLLLAAIVSGHLVLLLLARLALGRNSTDAEMLRAGTAHLFLSMGVVCLPFAFLTNTIATAVVTACYLTPLLLFPLGYFTLSAPSSSA